MTTQQLIHARLEEAAMKVSKPFCYGCYKPALTGRCHSCGSDDLMRHLEGVGVEYGTDWIIKHLLKTHCAPVDGVEMFEELLDECYPEVKVGCCTFSPSQVMKELDPVCFNIGVQENLDSLAEDGQLYEQDGNYYRIDDIDSMLDDLMEG
jgi:hypothetical protein